MKTLIATEATERHWCNYCPDLIIPGESVAAADGFTNPFGEPGFAHRDCAVRKGHEVIGDGDRILGPDAVVRLAFRVGGHSSDSLSS